jgi:hypothetical protein
MIDSIWIKIHFKQLWPISGSKSTILDPNPQQRIRIHNTESKSTILDPNPQYCMDPYPQYWIRIHSTGSESTILDPNLQYWIRIHNTGSESTILDPNLQYWIRIKSLEATKMQLLWMQQTIEQRLNSHLVHGIYIRQENQGNIGIHIFYCIS